MYDSGYLSKYIVTGPNKELKRLYDYFQTILVSFDDKDDGDLYIEDFLKRIDMIPKDINIHTGKILFNITFEKNSWKNSVRYCPLKALHGLSNLKDEFTNCVFFETWDDYEPTTPIFNEIINKVAPNCFMYYMSIDDDGYAAYTNDVSGKIFGDADFLVNTDIDPEEEPEDMNQLEKSIYNIITSLGDLDSYFSEKEILSVVYKIDTLIGKTSSPLTGIEYISSFNQNFIDQDLPYDFYIYGINKDANIEAFDSFASRVWKKERYERTPLY